MSRQVTVFPTGRVVSVTHQGTDTADVRVHLAVPASLSPATHVVVVMHGVHRDADAYCAGWLDWAGANDYLVVCPELDDDHWPGAESYNLGNMFATPGGDGGIGSLQPESRWAFTVVRAIHRSLRAGFGLRDDLFDLWGHSAGGQFVSRFVLFCPGAPIRYAIAANAGWYTMPDRGIDVPYGTRHPEITPNPVFTRAHLVVMRGEADTVRDVHLRTGPDADAQGLNRFERAGTFHAAGLALDPDSSWQLVDVPDAGHQQTQMAPAAQAFLADAPALPFECPLPTTPTATATATATATDRA